MYSAHTCKRMYSTWIQKIKEKKKKNRFIEWQKKPDESETNGRTHENIAFKYATHAKCLFRMKTWAANLFLSLSRAKPIAIQNICADHNEELWSTIVIVKNLIDTVAATAAAYTFFGCTSSPYYTKMYTRIQRREKKKCISDALSLL